MSEPFLLCGEQYSIDLLYLGGFLRVLPCSPSLPEEEKRLNKTKKGHTMCLSASASLKQSLDGYSITISIYYTLKMRKFTVKPSLPFLQRKLLLPPVFQGE